MNQKKVCYIVSDIDKAVFFEITAKELQNKVDLSFILINGKNSHLNSYLKTLKIPVSHVECSSLLKSISPTVKIWRILRKNKIDNVHCHLHLANWIGLFAAYFARVKSRIYTLHAGERIRKNRKEAFIDFIQDRLSTKIVAISKNSEQILLKRKVPKSKIKLIYHCFDFEKFQNLSEQTVTEIKQKYNPNNQFPIIGVIARNIDWKGIEYTLTAFIELLKKYPSAKICLFGGDFEKSNHKITSELLNQIPKENKEIVAFETNIYALYSLFDMYVHVPINATCEAFGQTYIEAIYSNCNCIFTLSGIASEIVEDRKNAYVVDYKNSDQIVKGFHYFISNERKVTSNEEMVDLFSIKNYINSLLNMYFTDKK